MVRAKPNNGMTRPAKFALDRQTKYGEQGIILKPSFETIAAVFNLLFENAFLKFKIIFQVDFTILAVRDNEG